MSAGPVTAKIDNLISKMDPQGDVEQKQSLSDATAPEQPSSEYDLSKPYRVVVREGNQGGAEKLVIENFDVDAIVLKSNEVLIDIRSSGVNFIDTYHRSGLYKNVLQLGKEGAGVIAKIGDEVENYKVGASVCWFSIQGSYATHIVTAMDNLSLMKIPEPFFTLYDNDDAVFDLGASIGIQALTAHYLCRSVYPVGDKCTVLIHAGAGGTGGILIQICKKILKAKMVIATVGSEEKKKVALQYGADHVILYKTEDFVQRVLELTSNAKASVVFDGVGKATHKGSLECTAVRGMCVFFGNASGPVPAIDPLTLASMGSIFMTRPTLNHYIGSKEELQWRYSELCTWVQAKEVNIRIGQSFNLSKVFDAHKALESRNTIGKIILKKGDSDSDDKTNSDSK